MVELANDYINKFGSSALVYRYKGQALIEMGDIQSAVHLFQKSILLNNLAPISYFFNGVCIQNDITKSESLFKKAIYLKSEFPEAYYHLALIQIKRKNISKGIKYFNLAMTSAKKKPVETLVLNSNETLLDFITSIEKNILYYQGLINEQ